MKFPGKSFLRVVAAAAFSGLLFAGWWFWQQRQERNVPILMYHRIGNEGDSIWWVHTEDFEKHLSFLKQQGYESILPADLVAHRHWGRPLPEKPVIFTFDDGYANSLQNAEPLLRKYGFRGIVYLVTSRIADAAAGRGKMEGTELLTWQEVAEMQKRGTLVFGGHTRTHANLAATANPYPEIKGCYKEIKKKGGFVPHDFCYPHGEYRNETLKEVKRAGFSTAVTCKNGLFRTHEPGSFLELPRLSVYGGTHIYHAETINNDLTSITLKIWKEGCKVTSLPRLSTPGMNPDDGWLAPASISTTPVTLVWNLPQNKRATPLVLELWGDQKLLPHWRHELGPPQNLK